MLCVVNFDLTFSYVLAGWEGSAHNNVTGEQFRHWDDAAANPDGVPTTCAKCHSTKGYMDYIGADGSEANKTDAPVPAVDAQGVQCAACHNPVTLSKTTVMFPSGVTVTAGDDSRCMECHQGRESKVSVDKQINETFAKVENEEEMLVFNDKNPWPQDAVAPNTPLPF